MGAIGYPAAVVSFPAFMFGLCNRGGKPLWGGQRRLVVSQTDHAVPPLGRARL